jgi:hypothetical protein
MIEFFNNILGLYGVEYETEFISVDIKGDYLTKKEALESLIGELINIQDNLSKDIDLLRLQAKDL